MNLCYSSLQLISGYNFGTTLYLNRKCQGCTNQNFAAIISILKWHSVRVLFHNSTTVFSLQYKQSYA